MKVKYNKTKIKKTPKKKKICYRRFIFGASKENEQCEKT